MSRTPVLLLFGILLLGAVAGGRIAARLGLPPLTGQLGAGLLLGAACASWVDEASGFLAVAQQCAGAVILFWIGTALRFARLRASSRTLGAAITGLALAVPACALAALSMGALGVAPAASDALVVALVLSTASPTIVALVAREPGADEDASKLALDAAVLASGAIAVVLIAVLATMGGGGAPLALLADISAGLAIGGALGAVLAWGAGSLPSSFHGACALAAILVLRAVVQQFEPALAAGALLAGAAIANGPEAPRSEQLVARVGAAIPTASAILFVAAGATTDLELAATVAIPALAIVVIRACALWLGWGMAGAIIREPISRRLASAPLLPQAGFSLALAGAIASIVDARALALVLAVVAINELAMPPILRAVLRRATPHAATP